MTKIDWAASRSGLADTTEPSDVPPLPRLIGRRSQIELIADIAAQLADGTGSVVAFDGVAGIGKTALAAALAHRLGDLPCRVVWGRAAEHSGVRPFGPLVDALRCRSQHPDPRRAAVAAALVDAGERTADPFRFHSETAWRYPAQEALLDLLLDLADEGPIAVVVDDVQWADEGTIDVLGALARRTERLPLVVAWTMRPLPRPIAVERLIDRAGDRLALVRLAALPTADAQALAAELAGRPLSDDSQSAIAAAQGNPYLIAAATRGLGSGMSSTTPAEWYKTLPAATAEAVMAGAVLGRVFAIAELAAMLGIREDMSREALSVAISASMVRLVAGGTSAEFTHDLVREGVLAPVPAPLLAALHRDVVRVLERAGASIERIATHLALGAARVDERAAARIRTAAASIVRYDSGAAADLLARAAALCHVASPEWLATMTDRITALQWAGRTADAVGLADAAMAEAGRVRAAGAVLDSLAYAQLQIVRAWGRGMTGDLPGCVDEIRRVADERTLPAAGRAYLMAELATLEVWGNGRAAGKARAVAAIELAREHGVMQAELQAMCALSLAESFEGNVREGVERAREAQARGRKFTGLAPARELYLGLALANADEIDEAMLWVGAGHEIAAKVADLWLISRHQTARTAIGWISGDWEVVVADAEAVVALRADTGILNGLPQVAAIAAMVALNRGDRAALVRWTAISRESTGPGAEMAGMLYHGWMEALVAEHEGRIGDGAALLVHVYETAGEAAPLVQVWLAGDLVRIALAAGDRVRAESVVDAMTVLAKKVGTASARATLSWCRGQLAQHAGSTDRAIAEFRSAFVAAGSVRRSPLERAVAVALVGCLREAGLRAEAESVAGVADELTGALGIAASSALSMPLSSTTEAPSTAAVSRQSPAKRRRTNFTPTEERIATLVAEGLSNTQIALAAKMSKRTVEFYLSSLYIKLGLSNRVELAAHVAGWTAR